MSLHVKLKMKALQSHPSFRLLLISSSAKARRNIANLSSMLTNTHSPFSALHTRGGEVIVCFSSFLSDFTALNSLFTDSTKVKGSAFYLISDFFSVF